jgi:hypothetical protein
MRNDAAAAFYATARFAGVNDIPRDLGCLILNEKGEPEAI